MTDESRTVPGRYQVASLIMLMLDVLGLLGLLYGTTVVAAKFRQIFADLLESRPLPALARLVLSIPARVALPFFVGAMASLIYKEVRMGNKSRALVINAATLTAIVIMSVLLVLALFGPLTVIITSLSK